MKLAKNIITLAAGATVGLLFAQRSGKDLRDELVGSKDPWGIILKEAGLAGKEAKDSTIDWVKNSKELQEVITSGKGQFDEMVKGASAMGTETAEVAKAKLEELAKNAQAAAKELGEKTKEQLKSTKTAVDEKTESVKKTAKKTVKKATDKLSDKEESV